MDALIASFSLISLSEIGDKTQLLALMLAAKYRKPVPILLGIFAATLVNFALAAWVGASIGALNTKWLNGALALSFIAIGLWELKPEKREQQAENKQSHSPFMAALIGFLLGELGDKTQIAALALGAKYHDMLRVTLGATLGMLAVNVPTVLLGHALFNRLPVKLIRRAAAALFIALGLWMAAKML